MAVVSIDLHGEEKKIKTTKGYYKELYIEKQNLFGLKKSEIDNLLMDTCDSLGVQVRV